MSNENNVNPTGNNGAEKLFTQSELDTIVKERLERERKRYSADADAMNELNKQMESLQAELSQLKEDKAAQAKQLKTEKIKNVIVNELNKGNAVNTSSLLHIFTGGADMADDESITYTGEDGKTTLMSDAIAKWLKNNDWAVKCTQIPGSGYGGRGASGYNRRDELREAFGLKRKE